MSMNVLSCIPPSVMYSSIRHALLHPSCIPPSVMYSSNPFPINQLLAPEIARVSILPSYLTVDSRVPCETTQQHCTRSARLARIPLSIPATHSLGLSTPVPRRRLRGTCS